MPGTLDTVDNEHTEMAGAVIVMAIVGAAVVPAIQGWRHVHCREALILASMLCFCFTLAFTSGAKAKCAATAEASPRPEEINHDNTSYYIMAGAFSESSRVSCWKMMIYGYGSLLRQRRGRTENTNSRGRLRFCPGWADDLGTRSSTARDPTMRNMFRQPKPAAKRWQRMAALLSIPDYWRMAARRRKIHIRCTARCLRCHGLPLELEGDSLRVTGRYEYVMGFGHHYQRNLRWYCVKQARCLIFR